MAAQLICLGLVEVMSVVGDPCQDTVAWLYVSVWRYQSRQHCSSSTALQFLVEIVLVSRKTSVIAKEVMEIRQKIWITNLD